MFRPLGILLLTVAAVAVTLMAPPAPAQGLLKPRGQGTLQLRAKSVQADVAITGQFATTELNLVYQNETYRRVEADFMYALPEDTVVTYFAYWFGEEKVVARVVEKERAAAIYQHITSRQRDPALIEMVGKNKFRARIFPVMPNADLRVQMKFASALPGDENGALYLLPLQAGEGQELDSIDVTVRISQDDDIKEIINNYGLEATEDSGESILRLTGTNFRPPKDLRVRIRREPKPLHVSLYAAPSGGRDGFFALSLTPDHTLKSPRVRISGVSVYHVEPARLSTVKAHHSLAVFGRYRGSGAAKITLSGQSPAGWKSYTAEAFFPAKAEPNNLATKLWGARRIERLSRSTANRRTVVWLSKRFGMPSKFTSWLAVPKSEMKRYKREQAEAEMFRLVKQVVQGIGAGRDKSAHIRRLRRRLGDIAKGIGYDADAHINDEIYTQAEQVAHDLAMEKRRERPNRRRSRALQRKLDRLLAVGPGWMYEMLQQVELTWLHSDIRAIEYQLEQEYGRQVPASKKLQRLEAEFKVLAAELFGEDGSEWADRYLKVIERVSVFSRELATAQDDGDEVAIYLAKLDLRHNRDIRSSLGARLNVRWGDPLIAVDAPADAQRVVAILPTGEVKQLVYNADRQRWEARFDVPTYAAEGEYVIRLIIVLRDGVRQRLTMRYHVDLTPPTGRGLAAMVGAGQPKLRLELEGSDDLRRVAALLPWGERVEMRSTGGQRFFALVDVPVGRRGEAVAVTYILTDRAHNRTTLTVDLSDTEEE